MFAPKSPRPTQSTPAKTSSTSASAHQPSKQQADATSTYRQDYTPRHWETIPIMAPPLVSQVVGSAGKPLEERTKQEMSGLLGTNLDAIRLHEDSQAATSARAIGAAAYSLGPHIVFAAQRPPEASPAGRYLLAHELAHAVQQRYVDPAASTEVPLGAGDTPMERQAHSAAEQVMLGKPASLSGGRMTTPVVQCLAQSTYISMLGAPEYLRAAEEFHKRWGYPNVKHANTMMDVLTDLDTSYTAPGSIQSFRIVSHGMRGNFKLGFMSGLPDVYFGSSQAKFRSAQDFRQYVADRSLQSDPERAIVALIKNPATAKHIAFFGVKQGQLPASHEPLGIVLRAIFDSFYATEAGEGQDPKSKMVVERFNQLRIDTYTKLITDKNPEADSHLTALKDNARAVFEKEFDFPKVGGDELTTSLVDQTKKLDPLVEKAISEGAGGPYARTLERVRHKIAPKATIEIRGCNVGESVEFLNKMSSLFEPMPTGSADSMPFVNAPDLFQYYWELQVQRYPEGDGDQNLKADWNKSDNGLSESYDLATRLRRGEIVVVEDESSLEDIARRYQVDVGVLRRLNSGVELRKGIILRIKEEPVADRLIRREVAIVKDETSLAGIAGRYNVDEDVLQRLNPDVKLAPGVIIQLKDGPQKLPPLGPSDLAAELKAGKAFTSVDQKRHLPVARVSQPRQAEAIGDWLTRQRYDTAGRSKEKLTTLFAGNDQKFAGAIKGTYIEFLSAEYPIENTKDPIFADDPRYKNHFKVGRG